MFDFIKYKYIWLSISGALVAISVVLLVLYGFNFGIDFTGGSIINLEFTNTRPPIDAIRQIVSEKQSSAVIFPKGDFGAFIRLKFLSQDEYNELIFDLKSKFETETIKILETSYETVGPTVGQELKTRAINAIIATIMGIIIFIAWAFRRVSYPVASWKYGVIAIVALLHDILIPTGVFVILGKFFGFEIDILFVTALLTILGYSVNDTIIIFDRIRENLIRDRHKPFNDVINNSLNETLVRSINTSFTVILVLTAILVFGGESIRNFTLALLIGVIAGTYSSIFIASPLLAIWAGRLAKKGV